jgi:predicted GTPase
MSPPLEVAVVGHTNAGKTSLLRTLARRRDVGEVSPSPATTRRVEPIALRVDGVESIVLLDTPGLEDSIGLLEAVDAATADRRADRIAALESFLASPAATREYPQEIQALEAARRAELMLAVIDARDRVLPRHLDELELLGRCGRPVVPVLNFVASADADAEAWRASLGRLGMHAVVAFDTVAYEVEDERRLFEAIRTLVPEHRGAIDRLLEARQRERDRRRTASASRIADLLLDAASMAIEVQKADGDEGAAADSALDALRDRLRNLEHAAHLELLAIAGFDADDAAVAEAALESFDVGVDLFSPEAFKTAGFSAATGAAAGAATGAAIDLAVGGMSLGAAAALGAAIGGVLGAAGRHARKISLLARGGREVLVGDASLSLLAARAIALVRGLERRGHASVEPLALGAGSSTATPRDLSKVVKPLREVRSRLASPATSDAAPSVARERFRTEIAALVVAELAELAELVEHSTSSRLP